MNPKIRYCYICGELILNRYDTKLIKCCNIHVHRKCIENYIKIAKKENKKILCPNCGVYLQNPSRLYHNFLLIKQFISIELIPLDENFSPLEDKKLEIHNNYILRTLVSISSYGLNGELEIDLRLLYYKTKLFDFIRKKNPIQIKFLFEQEKEDFTKADLRFTGYINQINPFGVTESFTSFKTFHEPKFGKATRNASSSIIKLEFIDPLKYFFSLHKPINLYLDKSYSDILKQHIDELKAGNYISINVDTKFKELIEPKSLIIIPGYTSLYDFWISTVEKYSGFLIYDFKYSKYTITNKKEVEKTNDDDINRYDKAYINNINIKNINRYNNSLEILSGIASDRDKHTEKNNDSSTGKAIFKNSIINMQNYNSIHQLECKTESDKFKNHYSHEAIYEINYSGFSFYLPYQTNHEITLKSEAWNKSFGEDDLSLNITQIELEFITENDEKHQPDQRTEKELDENQIKSMLASQSESLIKGITPFLKIKTNIFCENTGSKYSDLPTYIEPKYPITVHGQISVTDDILKNYNSDSPYFIYDGFTTQPADEKTDKKNTDNDLYSLSGLPEHFPAYRVKLPIFRDGSDTIIAVQYYPNISSERFFYPICNDHPVIVNLYQEYAVITGFPYYRSKSLIDKTRQINELKLGPENQSKLFFEENSKEQILKLEKNNEYQKIEQHMTFDNNTIKISYKE